jgi:hypothetical protein
MKQPPVVPNVNGLIFFLKDASTHFSVDEQSAIAASSAGQTLKQSYDRCSGHSRQFQDARMKYKGKLQEEKMQTSATLNNDRYKEELNDLKRQMQVHEMKYIDCLTYMTCPKQWKLYRQCWDNTIHTLSADQIQEYKNNGTLNLLCRWERVAIERCVGDTVANAIMAGDLSA